MLANFYVVTPVFNPWRFRSRYRLYREFAEYLAADHIPLYTIEAAFGARPFEVTEPGNPHHVRVRTSEELWHKERMINLAIQRLPADWEYVAWIDADVRFVRPDWALETVQLLQHYSVLQLFSDAIDLDPGHNLLRQSQGFVRVYLENTRAGIGLPPGKGMLQPCTVPYGAATMSTNNQLYLGHPGFAWAMRRDAFENLGGLFDKAILGAGDHHMALALVHASQRSFPEAVSPGYKRAVYEWETRCRQYIDRNIGFMPGSLLHYWHGRKADRRYVERWKILIEHQYDPETDLKYDSQGLYQFTDRSHDLAYDIRHYFEVRNEDTIEL